MQRKRPRLKAADLRVNVPLGKHFQTLTEQAAKFERTKTSVARILILDGLRRLSTGEWTIKEGVERP
jgi:hypothetical protein